MRSDSLSRLGQNEQIELLVIPANKSILSAVWISQERISESVKKGLTSYFSYNLFSSPLWSTILNVAEVVLSSSLEL